MAALEDSLENRLVAFSGRFSRLFVQTLAEQHKVRVVGSKYLPNQYR